MLRVGRVVLKCSCRYSAICVSEIEYVALHKVNHSIGSTDVTMDSYADHDILRTGNNMHTRSRLIEAEFGW